MALRRLLHFLLRTRDMVLRIPAVHSLAVEAYVDALYATVKDKKSFTRAINLVGGTGFWTKYGEQSIVTRSSFEAELVALYDTSSMVL